VQTLFGKDLQRQGNSSWPSIEHNSGALSFVLRWSQFLYGVIIAYHAMKKHLPDKTGRKISMLSIFLPDGSNHMI